MFVKSGLLSITFVVLVAFGITFGTSLRHKYIEYICKTDFSSETSGRYIAGDDEPFLPRTKEEAFTKYLLNDTWYGNHKVPMFRNNKFVVRYQINNRSNFPEDKRKMIFEALLELERHTCLRFWEIDPNRTMYKNFAHILYVTIHKRCGANRAGTGEGFVGITVDACDESFHYIHETMHALGFQHEHVRPDRNDYIKFNATNLRFELIKNFRISQGWRFGLDKYLNSTLEGLDPFGYDYESIMHYYHNAGAKNSNYSVIIPKLPFRNISKMGGTELSWKDKQKLEFFYGCRRYDWLMNELKAYPELFYYDRYHSFGYREDFV